jgi:hypothetical protein
MGSGLESGVVCAIHKTLNDSYLNQIQPLIDEGVVEVRNEEATADERALDAKLRKFIEADRDLVLPLTGPISGRDENEFQLKFLEPMVKEVHEELVGPLDVGFPIHLNAITAYYAGIFADFGRALKRNETTITSSEILNRLLQAERQWGHRKPSGLAVNEKIGENFAFDVLNASLLDIGEIEIEDILRSARSSAMNSWRLGQSWIGCNLNSEPSLALNESWLTGSRLLARGCFRILQIWKGELNRPSLLPPKGYCKS